MQDFILFPFHSEKSGNIDMRRTGFKIKHLCKEKNLSVKTIQRELYIGSFQSVYAWFSGKTLPSLDNIYQLSKLLGVSIDEMIVDTAEESPDLGNGILLDTGNRNDWFGCQRILAYGNGIVRFSVSN